MPLSEHEQRILDEIERRLADEDPKFARGVATATPRDKIVRRLKAAIGGFLAGFAIMLVGLFAELLLPFGIVAFVVMLPSAVVIVTCGKQIAEDRANADPKGQRWLGRAEERWKKRFDNDQH